MRSTLALAVRMAALYGGGIHLALEAIGEAYTGKPARCRAYGLFLVHRRGAEALDVIADQLDAIEAGFCDA